MSRGPALDTPPAVCSNAGHGPPLPRALALLLADRVTRSRVTGCHELAGVFFALTAHLPHDVTCAAYYAVTGVHAPADLLIQLLDPAGRPLGGGTVQLPISDPLAVVQGSGTFNVRFTQPGTHRLQLVCGGEVIAETPVIIGTPVSAPAEPPSAASG